MSVEFIYFDVGGVLVHDFSKTNKWEEMLDDLGLQGGLRSQFENLFDQEEPRICRGKDVDTLVPVLRDEFGLHLEPGYSLLEDFVSRFEKNTELEQIVYKLEGSFGLGLLTNMYPNMLQLIRTYGLLPDVLWNVVIDSSLVGMAKPDQEIFFYAEKKAQTTFDDILFVENSTQHLEAAQQRGWHTLLYDPANPTVSNRQLLTFLEE